MRRALLCVCLAGYFLLVTLLPARPQITDDDLKSAYQACRAALDRLIGDEGIAEDPQAEVLEKRGWWLARQWTLHFLDKHPAATAKMVERSMREGLAWGSEEVHVFRLDRDSFLIAVEYILFVAKRREHRFEIAWDLREDAENHKGVGEFPWAWSNSFETGGAGFAVHMLPSDAEGHRRFYVDGERWQGAGIHSQHQLSIWVWQGSRVNLLFAKMFWLSAEDPAGVSFDGRFFHVRTSRWRRTIRQEVAQDWRIRIGPHSVDDVGALSDTPTLDFVDTFLDRLLLGQPVDELASAEAIGALQPIAEDIVRNQLDYIDRKHAEIMQGRQDSSSSDWKEKQLGEFGLGAELGDWDQRGRKACLVITTPFGSDHDFTFVLDIGKRQGRPFVTKAKVITDLACIFAYDYVGGPRPAGAATKSR